MIASLPIEATRARFQTRPSNWLLQSALIALFAQLISAQEDDEAGGDNRGLQISSAKSAALRNSGKSSSGYPVLQVLCGGPSP